MSAIQANAHADALALREISADARDTAKASDFAGKNRSFPILKAADVAAAAKAIGRAGADNYSADKLKANIIRIAKRKGAAFVAQLPKTWRGTDATTAARRYADIFAGLITLSDAVDGQPRTSWIQLFKTGKFWDPRYGTFKITAQDLSSILDNFKGGIPEAPTRLPVDYNHGTSNPTSADAGKAAGWIADLALRASGEELWGLVEWTDAAADMIAAKEYQFVSPTFAYNFRHSSGDEIGTTLLAAAITNTPVLEGMQPLTLSQQGALRLADANGDPAAGADEDAEAMFSYDEQRRRVQAALSEAFGVVYGFGDCGPCQGCYLVDLFDGRAIYREYSNGGSGDLFEVGFDIDSAGDVHFSGTPIEVVADYRQLGEQQMAKTITVKDAKGNDVQLTEEVALALAKQHAPAPTAGAVDLAKFNELSAKVEAQDVQLLELTSTNAALKKDAKEREATAKVDALVRAGKITPADRAETLELAIANEAAFALYEKQLAKRPAVVRYDEGQRGSGEEGGSQSASDEVVALARAAQVEDPKLTSGEAMKQVFKKNPALYARYKAESAVRV